MQESHVQKLRFADQDSSMLVNEPSFAGSGVAEKTLSKHNH